MPTTEAHEVALRPDGLTPEEVVAVARAGARVTITDEATAAMQRAADIVAALDLEEEPVYGVSTGFGSLARVRIPVERRAELQRALVRSHASGMGPPIEREVVRAMMVLRARTLAMGWSGARPVVADTIAGLLNAGITPIVPEYGSLGASGDLAPLAHCALALIGEGEVTVDLDLDPDLEVDLELKVDAGREPATRTPAADALADAQITPLELGAKEGLALINGTDGMLGMLVLACADLDHLLRVADITAAMSVEALLGTDRAFAQDLVALRPQPGQAASAGNLFTLLAGSEIVASHRHGDPRVQDAYSLRCAPQVTGAARDTLTHARTTADHELRAAIDNPMVLPDGRVESCGNFHGAPVALACDFLADRDRRGGLNRRAPDRSSPGRDPLARAAGLPRRGCRRQLRADALPLRAGCARGREPPAGDAGERRLDPHERDAGGPRLDGVGCRPQAPHGGRQPPSDPRRRARDRGPRAGPPGAARPRARDEGRARR